MLIKSDGLTVLEMVYGNASDVEDLRDSIPEYFPCVIVNFSLRIEHEDDRTLIVLKEREFTKKEVDNILQVFTQEFCKKKEHKEHKKLNINVDKDLRLKRHLISFDKPLVILKPSTVIASLKDDGPVEILRYGSYGD